MVKRFYDLTQFVEQIVGRSDIVAFQIYDLSAYDKGIAQRSYKIKKNIYKKTKTKALWSSG